ncbi:hypothetical protein [Candidatus Pyrohabitans sp.]
MSYDGESFSKVADLGGRVQGIDHTSTFWLIRAGITPGRLVKYKKKHARCNLVKVNMRTYDGCKI